LLLHVLSDLHLEHGAPFELPALDADVLVLAGDIGRGLAGLEWIMQAAGRPVVFVAGNHEFYGHALPGLIGELRASAVGSPVYVLEDDEIVLDGVRFLGCTLWTDFEFVGGDAGRRARSMEIAARVVNDYKQVHFSGDPGGNRPLRPADTLAAHHASRAWLAQRLDEPFAGPTVVVTHHQPLIRSRPRSSALQAVGGAFASDLTAMMGGDRVQLWVYGHTHRAADLDVGGTRVVSNPRGYPHEPVAGFDPGLVVEVG
jgi:predicted phosphodiesterase